MGSLLSKSTHELVGALHDDEEVTKKVESVAVVRLYSAGGVVFSLSLSLHHRMKSHDV